MIGQQYFHAHGTHVVTGRFFQQVAPGGPETLAVQDFAMQIAMIELGVRVEPVLYHGNLEAERYMIDVRDSDHVIVEPLERIAPGQVDKVGYNRVGQVLLCVWALGRDFIDICSVHRSKF